MEITKIMKFGGTSVGSPDKFRALIPLIDNGETNMVVVSAMSGTTNSLIEITDLMNCGETDKAKEKINILGQKYRQTVEDLFESKEFKHKGKEFVNLRFDLISEVVLDEYTKSKEKLVHAQGELLSTTLLHMLLTEKGINSTLLQALNFMRIDKDGEPDYYYIEENIKRELRKEPPSNIIITQGFICRNAYGEVDNLKRGGSDYSASIIGAVLNVKEIQIWTDIDGFHNNDPRYVENTSVIRELSFDEAAELAYFGAKILHPSSVAPARMKNIPVRLKNTMHPEDEGTIIVSEESFSDYKAVAAKDGITVIRIKSAHMLMAYGFLRKVFEIFEAYRTPIDMVATSEVSISLTIDDTSNLERIVKELKGLGMVSVEHDQTIVCVVGDFRPETRGSAPEIFEALDNITLKMICYGGSSHSLSLLIDTKNKVEALRQLSKNLFK
ncbi:MAG TPA: aspartate kinase [Bacteroidetes bacterium]|nr:aspartate kinase [Bacteroidota bacterium]